MTPISKNRKPAPYREKGSPKTRAVKFVVTEDEMEALEMLAKDWGVSVAQAVRILIAMSEMLVSVSDWLTNTPQLRKKLLEMNVEPSEMEWRTISIKRFLRYWGKADPINNKAE